MRLDPAFRRALYAVFAALFVTGAGWLFADQMKDAASSEAWQVLATYLLMLHGGASMATLLLLGALFPLHVRGGWHMRRNRITGTMMVAFNAVLVLTAFALYYSGSEMGRPWASWAHFVSGLFLPILLFIHIAVGRGSFRSSKHRQKTEAPMQQS